MLQDPEVDSLVTTVSLRQTAKRGMLLEHCDVAMIMDRAKPGAVKAFLVGLDVIIKATTRCIVVGSGNLVALKRIESVNNGAKLIVVNANRNDPSLQTHLDAGRIGVTAMWQDGQQNIAILSADKIIGSFSLEALADKNTDKPKVVNEAMLYAVGATFGAGLTIDEISEAIKQLPEAATRSKADSQ
jgi:hypothetical protein